MDFFADRVVKKIIGDIITHKEDLPSDRAVWISLTRQMFVHYPAVEVYELVGQSLCEASDEQWFEKKYPKQIFNETPKRKSVIKVNLRTSRIKKLINDNIKITNVAESYGLKIKNGMTICPFHNDTQASLGLDDTRNIFHCFGCNVKGDIIEFKRRMKKRWEKEKMQQQNF